MMVRKTGTPRIRYKPCETCGEEMPYKNIRKKYCDDCRDEMAYTKQEDASRIEERRQKAMKISGWDMILKRFKGRRTEEEYVAVLGIAGGGEI